MKPLPTTQRLMNKTWKDHGVENVILWEVVPVDSGETVIFQFESASDERQQGIWVAVNGYMEHKGNVSSRVCCWFSEDNKIEKFKVFASDNLLHFYNVWYSPHSVNNMGSQSYSSGMLKNELPEAAVYSCNDIGFENGFNSLEFVFKKTA